VWVTTTVHLIGSERLTLESPSIGQMTISYESRGVDFEWYESDKLEMAETTY